MKRAKERGLEPLRGLWWVEQSKGKLTKRPSSRQHRPLRNNSSNRKRKQEPRTNRVSTPSNEHFLHAWTLADTRSSDSLGFSPGKRLTGPGLFVLLGSRNANPPPGLSINRISSPLTQRPHVP